MTLEESEEESEEEADDKGFASFFQALVMASSSISVSDAGVGGSATGEDVEAMEEIEQESGASGDVGSGSASRDEALDLGAGVCQWAFPDEDQADAEGGPSDSSAVADNSFEASETRQCCRDS